MIVVLRHDDVGQQPGAGAAAGDRVIGRRRGDNGVAGPARQLLADMPDHLEATWHVVERLADVLADPAQRAAAGGQAPARRVPHFFARQMLWQRPACRLLCFDRASIAAATMARRRPAAQPGRSPAPRSPTRVVLSRAPASPRNGRTRPADNGPAGSSAWQSLPAPPPHRCAIAAMIALQRSEIVGQLLRRDRHASD